MLASQRVGGARPPQQLSRPCPHWFGIGQPPGQLSLVVAGLRRGQTASQFKVCWCLKDAVSFFVLYLIRNCFLVLIESSLLFIHTHSYVQRRVTVGCPAPSAQGPRP